MTTTIYSKLKDGKIVKDLLRNTKTLMPLPSLDMKSVKVYSRKGKLLEITRGG